MHNIYSYVYLLYFSYNFRCHIHYRHGELPFLGILMVCPLCLPPSCAVVTKSGNLNFLESSGPFRVCKGTALPLPFVHQLF